MVLIIPASLVLICVILFALLLRRGGVAEICKRIRKMAVWLLSFSVACIVGVVLLITTFSYTSDYFNSVLSPEFITETRLVLKAVFGSESVFTSLQMLGALSLFLFTFASCAFGVYGVCVLLLRRAESGNGGVADYKENAQDMPVAFSVRRFALLSRYLL